ncbi:guanine nucleotide binding protein (G-protein), alpha subunit, partial [Kipferlia bialata]
DRFLGLNRYPTKEIYAYATTATDTHNVENVFSACVDIILKSNLRKANFI